MVNHEVNHSPSYALLCSFALAVFDAMPFGVEAVLSAIALQMRDNTAAGKHGCHD